DDRLSIDGELDRLADGRITEAFRIGTKTQDVERLGGFVVRLQPRAVGEPIKGPCEIGLEDRRRGHVDLASEQRIECRGPAGEEMLCDAAAAARSESVVL